MHTDEGHRQRLKNRFLAEGLDSFEEVHALELLLFYAVPRKDTKPLARALLDHFGSLAPVLEATAEELEMVPGVGRNIATFLTLTTAMGRYYQTKRTELPTILDSTEACGQYLLDHYYGRRNETVFLLCLDAKGKLLCCRKMAEGDVNSANVPVRRVVEIALAVNASAVLLAHNHPSGIAVPSKEDVLTTEYVARALAAMDILLTDHIVVADGDYVSMVQSGLYSPKDFYSMR
ncbi:MAG: DNA repair protein RadC [Oscillospiraceae bacterium]|nr:DNA repair protein RadC [Oscillospiraceae bacterium]